jgi:hypothetical protein
MRRWVTTCAASIDVRDPVLVAPRLRSHGRQQEAGLRTVFADTGTPTSDGAIDDQNPRDDVVDDLHPGHRAGGVGRHRDRDGVPRPPRQHGQHRAARLVGSPLCIHFRGQHQRLGVRGPVGEHAVLQHRIRPGDAAGQIPADDSGARTRRIARSPGSYARVQRHAAHPPSAIRRPGCCGDGYSVCTDIFCPP